jgi:hypothetical protein
VTLPPNSPVLFYLQRLRDEAHRFASERIARNGRRIWRAARSTRFQASAPAASGLYDALRNRASREGGGARGSGAGARHITAMARMIYDHFSPARMSPIAH